MAPTDEFEGAGVGVDAVRSHRDASSPATQCGVVVGADVS